MDYMPICEAPMNIDAERIVLSTIICDSPFYGRESTRYATRYLNKNCFCDTFHQDVFKTIKALERLQKEATHMSISQYMIEHNMASAEVVYGKINSLNERCEEITFWRFVKLLESMARERENMKLLSHIAFLLEGNTNEKTN